VTDLLPDANLSLEPTWHVHRHGDTASAAANPETDSDKGRMIIAAAPSAVLGKLPAARAAT
jgi:hypothetical protein